jgi:hypothetical protein
MEPTIWAKARCSSLRSGPDSGGHRKCLRPEPQGYEGGTLILVEFLGDADGSGWIQPAAPIDP